MQDFIADIYKFGKLTSEIKECIKLSRAGVELEVKERWLKIQPSLMDMCVNLTYENAAAGKNMFDTLSQACAYVNGETGDYIAFADALEETLPLLYGNMSHFGRIDVEDGVYRLYSSTSGLLTLENSNLQQRYHSEYDPLWEAYERAIAEYDASCISYHFLGCGLGYLPYQISRIADRSVNITIYHNKPEIIDYAMNYGVLSWIPENKLNIVIEDDTAKLIERFLKISHEEGRVGFAFLKDVIESFSKDQIDKIYEMDTLNKTRVRIAGLTRINLYRNIFNVRKTAHIFKPKTEGKEWIVVAGGPSVDTNIDYIRNNMGKKVIICASTIFKRLMESGIVPDAVAVLDPQSRTFGHFENIECDSVPLIMAATANWHFSEYYGGDKYLIAGTGNREAIEIFERQGLEPWFLGTTVSTMLLTIAIHAGAQIIHFVGIDLSYPNGNSHAINTMDSRKVDTTKMLDVMAVNGENVKTTEQFMIYYKEIQKIILDNQNVEFVNHSNDGIMFEGSKWYKELM